MFLIVFYLFTKRESVWDKIVLGGLFAIMMMTNTWDVPTYGLLMSVWLFWTVVKNPNQIGQWLQKTMLVFGTMMLVSIPWWLKFQPISSGIAFVNLRSPIWQLAVLWSASWLICFLGWMVAKKSEAPVFVRALIITTILLVLIPELVYAKDIYPDHPRANTMFKLTYQACIMTGIIFGATTGKIVEELKKKFSILKATLLFILMLTFGSLMIFPTVSFPSFFENFATLRGLDGELWLKDKSPEKYEVVQYLKQKRDGKNMVEAVGDSYTDLNVVSVYSGVPTVQGWRVHEWLWRGGYESVGVREKQVKEIYEGETITEAKKIMREYSVGWIFVGSDEEDKYLINHPKIRSLGKMVWEMNESYLIKVE
ncbi:MAG: hypothetical protein ACD_22C00154G0002 [uncultured bacterium]|nr:MAG: hypothetical protein ACD_22C00154G0002 [uncultured bacterium]